MKILNTHAGLGGNRQGWPIEFSITAVESNLEVAEIYADRFPQDVVVVGDAYEYLVDHYKEFDFIWMSPTCTTHSQYRYNVGVRAKGYKPVMPDMMLYSSIVFLQHHFNGKWVVENVRPYYELMVKDVDPQIISRHYFWANFYISSIELPSTRIRDKNKISSLEKYWGIDLSSYKIKNKRQLLRNCVHPKLGLHILQCALSNNI